MERLTKVLLLLAVVAVTAYVAGSLASSGAPAPTDHSPVILRDAPADPATTVPGPTTPPPQRSETSGTDQSDDGPTGDPQQDDADEARVVTPRPTPVGEDDDDESDDDGPGDDDTDERDDDGDD